MKKKRVYCSYCGAPVTVRFIDEKYRDFCESCKTTFYENPLPVASCIVINEKREVLLVQRKNDPYKNMWCLPIGFAETGESIEQAALRELKEEAGVTGQIVRIIDVDTVSNYFYGDLAIITFEVKQLSHEVKAGDDALDAKFFPLTNYPPLAWESNEKAIKRFIEIYKDVWSMIDSLNIIHPTIATHHDIPQEKSKQYQLISTIIASMIESEIEVFHALWQNEIPKYNDSNYLLLLSIHQKALETIKLWLTRSRVWKNFREFTTIGMQLKKHNVPLKDILTAIAISRKSIWVRVIEKNILHSPLDIYTALEINNRIILFYDKITYFLMKGYEHTHEK
ncbi:MAG: NUDIX domain-containing protein [Spirochaetes bacterium]|nr:NUDIX domain-containing protein [Spirochaetota bacterium]